MRLYFFVAVAIACQTGFCDPPTPTAKPTVKVPEGMEGLSWHKWDTDHFVVISLDKSEGSSMRSEAESTRADLLARWGVRSGPRRPCKLVFVPDAAMLKKLFGLSSPRFEVRRSESGEVSECAIWIDGERDHLLASLIAGVEFSSGDFRPFVVEGIPLLERSPSLIREELLASKESPAAKVLGEGGGESSAANSAIACLLLRKEFGARAFGRLAASSSAPVHVTLGFATDKDLQETFVRYRANLLEDIRSDRTPDKYLRAGP